MAIKEEFEGMKNQVLIPFIKEKDSLDNVCQLLTKGTELAQGYGWGISVLYFGKEDSMLLDELKKYGAKQIFIFDSKEELDNPAVADIVSEMIPDMENALFLFSATKAGKEISSILSIRFEIGLTADCIEVQPDESGGFIFSRAAVGDSVIADIVCVESSIYMCTVKKGAFKKNVCSQPVETIIHKLQVEKKKKRIQSTSIIECLQQNMQQSVSIEKYDIVFGIGRGVKKQETREKIYDLAKKFNAGIAGTKAVIDEQWLPYAQQVGQSGKSISPKIYIGFGISGASQHVVGILNAKKIIAVNQDENAMIFQYADYAIVDNVENVVDAMERISKEREDIKNS